MSRFKPAERVKLASLLAIVLLGAGCAKTQPERVEVGNVIKRLSSTEELAAIKYRLIDYQKPGTELVKKNIDFMDYTLHAQKGGSILDDVLIAFHSCSMPIRQVEEFHMVKCSVAGDTQGELFLMGDERAISRALHIPAGAAGVIVGGNSGSHESLPIVSVVGEFAPAPAPGR